MWNHAPFGTPSVQIPNWAVSAAGLGRPSLREGYGSMLGGQGGLLKYANNSGSGTTGTWPQKKLVSKIPNRV